MAEQQSKPSSFKLSEDWLATIVGLIIVLIVGVGVLGPGPQTAKLTTAAGESMGMEVLARDDWKITATVGGEKFKITAPYTNLESGKTYAYECRDGQILPLAEAVDTATREDADKAYISLLNNCDAKVVMTYQTDLAIRWPIFGLFTEKK
ncbi:hypothetical protein ANRL2_02649 [Anaerolineae bacterium]|nr:hypothetical protein ANRL2_02649 [Anaerolineae bacterium]